MFTSSSSYAYSVVGGYKCGQILAYDRDNHRGLRNHTISWFKGYLTALNSENAAFDEGNDVSNVPDDDSIYYYLVNYCRNNPLKDIVDASDALYLKLRGY